MKALACTLSSGSYHIGAAALHEATDAQSAGHRAGVLNLAQQGIEANAAGSQSLDQDLIGYQRQCLADDCRARRRRHGFKQNAHAGCSAHRRRDALRHRSHLRRAHVRANWQRQYLVG